MCSVRNSKSRDASPTIFYGICGEGLGHYARAAFLIPQLQGQGYQVEIFTSRRVADLCEQRLTGCPVHRVPGMRMHYQDNRLHMGKTTWNNLNSIFQGPGAFRLFRKRARVNRPFCIISDYEPLASITGNVMRIPVIAFDHQQIATECRIDWGPVSQFNRGVYHFSNLTTYPHPTVRIISSFFHPPLKKPTAHNILIEPILRPEILAAEPIAGDHILVYQTSSTMGSLKQVLETLPGTKKVYGAKTEGAGQEAKPFDEQEFVKDLARCRFVVVNGGHTTLSEAFYLGKPVICFPVRDQAEQEINGHYVARLGYGISYQLDDVKGLPDFSVFLAQEESFRRNVMSNGRRCGNSELVSFVLKYLDSVR